MTVSFDVRRAGLLCVLASVLIALAVPAAASALTVPWWVDLTPVPDGQSSFQDGTATPAGEVVAVGSTAKRTLEGRKAVIAAYSTDGVPLWDHVWSGGHDNAAFRYVDCSDTGDVYAAGYTSLTELLVADYKANGRKRWIRTVVPFPNDPKPEVFPWAMTVGPGGSVYVACDYYYDELNYGWALVKLDARGRLSWVVTRPNGWSERLATDTEGNIYATGYGRARVGSYWGEECVTEKYSPAGELLWSSTYIPDASLQAWGEELEVVGTSVVVSGHYMSSFAPKGQPERGFVIKYDTSGTEQWVRSWTPPTDGAAWFGPTLSDMAGNIYVSAVYAETGHDYGVCNRTVVLKLDTTGSVVWTSPVAPIRSERHARRRRVRRLRTAAASR